MKRREFIALLGSAAASWPLAARAARRAGAAHRRIVASRPGRCGSSIVGPGVPAGARAIGLDHRTEYTDRTRWTKFDAEDTRKYAAELVALAPDVILATGNSTV
jgi:putative ABC transport system substrate-binding protein